MDIQIKSKMTQKEAFLLFDQLEPVLPEELLGVWRGSEILTGHPMDGLLSAARWYGKNILSDEFVHPLLFEEKNGKIFSGNPGMLPLKTFMSAPRALIKAIFTIITPFIRTSHGYARLRIQEYRGKRTAVMLYDQKPVIDIFARISENKILGVTDAKWVQGLGYFFALEKVK